MVKQLITQKQIDKALPEVRSGLKSYFWIQNRLYQCDVTKDEEFQRRYKSFYRVRRSQEWCQSYFALMQKAKNKTVNFETTLKQMRKKSGRLEASFVSKFIATLDPNKPVIDKWILKNFGLQLPHYKAKDRERKIVDTYNELVEMYLKLLKEPYIKTLIKKFSQRYPDISITDVKKIDLVFWKVRG